MFMQGFQRPKFLDYKPEILTVSYGEFYAQPFERGFGTTVGNALRRVLLSAIEGAAIVNIRIENAAHEFTALPGIKEDTTDILLNLKQVVFKTASAEPQTLKLKVQGPCQIRAKDIETTPHVEILNPDAHIATLNKDGELNAELIVRLGRGYVPAEVNFDPALPIGYIPLDSAHSPVRKVAYNVEGARVGHATDYEKLTLKIWTNGAITPQDAVGRAAVIIKDHIGLFVNIEESEMGTFFMDGVQTEPTKKILDYLPRSVEELGLTSKRAQMAIESFKIKTIGDLITKTEDDFLNLENFGRKSLNEIKKALSDMGLSLGMRVTGDKSGRQKQ